MKNKNLREKLEQIKILINECLGEDDSNNLDTLKSSSNKEKKTIPIQSYTTNPDELVLSIVNKVGNC